MPPCCENKFTYTLDSNSFSIPRQSATTRSGQSRGRQAVTAQTWATRTDDDGESYRELDNAVPQPQAAIPSPCRLHSLFQQLPRPAFNYLTSLISILVSQFGFWQRKGISINCHSQWLKSGKRALEGLKASRKLCQIPKIEQTMEGLLIRQSNVTLPPMTIPQVHEKLLHTYLLPSGDRGGKRKKENRA